MLTFNPMLNKYCVATDHTVEDETTHKSKWGIGVISLLLLYDEMYATVAGLVNFRSVPVRIDLMVCHSIIKHILQLNS